MNSPTQQPRRQYTFRDVYNAARTERSFNYSFWIDIILNLFFENALKYMSKCLVFIATLLIICIASVGFFIVLPIIAPTYGFAFFLNLFWGLFLLYSIAFNYYMAVNTSAGIPSEILAAQTSSDTNCSNSRNSNNSGNGIGLSISMSGNIDNNSDSVRVCKKCHGAKPPRAHHCSVCGQCIMKMDHHCPWINNCVGHGNYRYFCGFLLWTTIATAYLACVMFPEVMGDVGLFSLPSELQPRIVENWQGGASGNGNGKRLRGYNDNLSSLSSERKMKLTNNNNHTPNNGNVNLLQPFEKTNKEIEETGKVGVFTVIREMWGFATMPDVSKEVEERRRNRRRQNENEAVAMKSVSADIDIDKDKDTVNKERETEAEGEGEGVGEGRSRKLLFLLPPHAHDTHSQFMLASSSSSMSMSMSIISPIAIMVNAEKIQSVLDSFPPSDVILLIAFIFTVGVFSGVSLLCSFHSYLVLSGQTTLEFYQGMVIRARYKREGKLYRNPYDQGVRLNFEQVFGKYPVLYAILPLKRDPPPLFLGNHNLYLPQHEQQQHHHQYNHHLYQQQQQQQQHSHDEIDFSYKNNNSDSDSNSNGNGNSISSDFGISIGRECIAREVEEGGGEYGWRERESGSEREK